MFRRARQRHRRKKLRNASLELLAEVGAPGSSPGTLEGEVSEGPTSLRVFAWNADGDDLIEEKAPPLERVMELHSGHDHFWLDIHGEGDVELLARITEQFHIHPLVLEDCVRSGQRAKIEEYDDYVFIVAWMMRDDTELERDQLNIILGRDWLITIQSDDYPAVEPVRDRLRRGRKRMRKNGMDYLAYALLDSVIDHYMPILERQGDAVEDLEDQIADQETLPSLHVFHELKRTFIHIRRSIWPLREAVNGLIRDRSEFFADETLTYLRDAHDHAVQVIEITEIYRELAASLMDLQASLVSNRMNEVMKVLTIISTIFIPATFVSSIYGMNFDTRVSELNMPELAWTFGYPFALGIMSTSMLLCLFYFWRKGWLSSGDG